MARGHGDLLEDALDVWAETRAQVFAEAVDQLTTAVLTEVGAKPSPSTWTPAVFHDHWFKQIVDSGWRGRAAAQLFERLPGDDGATRADALAQRLRSLYRVGPDPRVGYALANAIAAGEPLLGYIAALHATEQLLIECRDERTCAMLSAIDTDDEMLAVMIQRVLAKPAIGRKPTRRELDRFATALQPRAAPVADTAALLAQVHAQPTDDTARSVLADALQAQGDPRGEFIALQLGGGEDGARIKRVDQLVQACGLEWLDGLEHIAYRVQFRRGFIARLELSRTYSEISPKLRTNAALATVEELVPGEARGDAYASLLTSPAMKVLRRIQVYDRPSLDALPEAPATVEHVSCPWLKRGAGNYVRGLTERVFPECIRRGVRSLGIAHEGLLVLLKSKLRESLVSLTLGDGGPLRVVDVWDKLPPDCELIINRWGELEECLSVRVAWLGDLRLVREDRGVVARAWGSTIEGVAGALPDLPKLAALIVEGASAAQEKQLIAATKKRKVALELQPAARRTGYFTIKR